MARLSTAVTSILVLLLIGAPLVAQDWAGKGRAHGIVRDEQGNPIEGVMITLKHSSDPEGEGPDPLYTNAKGRWMITGLLGGNWIVLLDKEGYMPSQGTVRVNEFQSGKAVEVVLAPNPGAAITRGDEYLDAGDYSAAREQYLEAMPTLDETGQARLRSRIGDTYLAEGNNAAARGEYEKALPYIPPEEQTHIRLQMANSYQGEGKYAAARSEYEALLPGLTPEGKAQVLMTIAQGYGAEENINGAIDTLIRANNASPGNTQILQLLADLLMREGRDAEAQEYMAQLPEDAELPTDMVLNMGIRLYNEGNMAEAIDFFERAVAEHPEEPEAYYYRGLTYLSQGRNDDAMSDLNKVLELDPASSHRAEIEEFLKFLEQGG